MNKKGELMDEKIIAETITAENERSEIEVNKNDLVFSVHVYAVATRDGKILISPQWKENGYDFPGGRVDLGENHIDAIMREVKEETGYTVQPTRVIDVITSMFKHPKRDRPYHSILIYYGAEIKSGEISTDGFDEHEMEYAKTARFVTFDELKTMELMSNQKVIKPIHKYLQRLRLNKAK